MVELGRTVTQTEGVPTSPALRLQVAQDGPNFDRAILKGVPVISSA